MESVPVLPIGSGEPRFSGRKACEAWMNEPLPDNIAEVDGDAGAVVFRNTADIQ